VDVSAARGADGQLHVALVNTDPDEGAKVEIAMPRAGGQVSGQILTATQMDSRNRFGATEEVRPQAFEGARWQSGRLTVAMPAKSLVVLTIP
jgi:alpha-N-arabinofuranosidase